MNSSFLLPLALACGWLLGPEALVIAGHAAGQMGWLSLPLLAAAALVFIVCNSLLSSPHLPAAPDGEFVLLQKSMGRIPAAGLVIASCLPLAILAATALLVTSGYTFNEVFFYRFPNFGFAFLLLALLTILQLFPERTIHRLQLCFVGLAAGGLLVLGLYGTFNAAKPVTEILQQSGRFSPASPALLLLLFAGSTFVQREKQSAALVPIAGFVIFFFWITASLAHVDMTRLADSTIPYMTAARKILGEPGRQIMGVIIISGTCAAVTGLVLLSRQKLSTLCGKETAADILSTTGQRWIVAPLIGVVTAILMATGLAGDELLETLLRGALLLWLLAHALLCLSALLWIKRDSHPIPLPAFMGTLILLAGLFTILLTDPRRVEMGIFILSTLGLSTLLAAVFGFIIQTKPTTTQPEETP